MTKHSRLTRAGDLLDSWGQWTATCVAIFMALFFVSWSFLEVWGWIA